MEQTTPKTPNLVASTVDTYCCSIDESWLRESKLQNAPQNEGQLSRQAKDEDLEVNYFKSTQWTPDGTSLLTSSADNTIRTFILPPTLLEDPKNSISLSPYTTHIHPTPINCLTPYPHFNLSDPATTLYLSTPTALPIRLTNSLSPSPTPAATYTLISPTTETYYTPSSLLWSAPGSFLAGTDCLIAHFNVSRNGEGPLVRLPTIPSKRHKMKGGGVGMRGLVSALSMQPSPSSSPDERGMLAAGTWTRWVGLYDTAGLGGTVATWSIAEAADIHAGIGGAGVTQTLWSNCGRYLYVVERMSRGVLVFDVRVTGKLVAWLEGRGGMTNQRLAVDVFEGSAGMEVWAGSVDGTVKVWEGVGLKEGGVEIDWEWKAHDDPVTSTVVHSSGTVVATCSGQRSTSALDESSSDSEESEEGNEEDESSGSEDSEDDTSVLSHSPMRNIKPISSTPDNSIKVWSL